MPSFLAQFQFVGTSPPSLSSGKYHQAPGKLYTMNFGHFWPDGQKEVTHTCSGGVRFLNSQRNEILDPNWSWSPSR